MEPQEKWEHLKKEHKKEEQEIVEVEVEVEETEPQIMTKEEKLQLKKQLIGMVWIIVIVIIASVVFIFGFKDKKNEKENIDDEYVEVEGSEPLKNGTVPVDDPTVKEINTMFKFETINPLYEENILKIYSLETTTIEDFDFSTKMLFLTSHKEFKKLIEDKGIAKENQKVSVTTDEISELSSKIFNKDIKLKYEDFKYYYEKDGNITYYDVILKDGKYTFKEITGVESKIQVYSKMFSCYKEENVIFIDSRVVFINETGVYSNPEMTELIGKRTDQLDKYVNSGYSVKFTYEIKNTGNIEYYFSETRTTSNATTPDYDFDYEEEVKESEEEFNKK